MKKYKLIQTVTDNSKTAWIRIADTGKLECVLNVSDDYEIRRYNSKKHLFYAYIKSGELEKISVYEKC